MIEIVIGILGGLVIGATGAGTGSLVTPLLILAGYSPVTAVTTGVGSLFLSKLAGTVMHRKLGHWPGRAGWLVAGGGALGVLAGALVTALVPGLLTILISKRTLGVTLLAAAAALTLSSHRASANRPESGAEPRPWLLIGAGACVAPLVALTSAGSGGLLVTLLMAITAWRVPELAATSNLFGSVVGALGFLVHWQVHGLDGRLFGLVMAGLIPGVLAGVLLSRVVSRQWLIWLVYLFTIYLGVALLA